MNFLLGADPELFLMKEGRFFSGWGMVEGDKATPQRVDLGAVQVDGMALEFNIDPASNKEEFSNNIQAVMSTLQSMVPEYELTASPTAEFGSEYMASMPDEAKELGCDPDFNAYTSEANETPDGNVTFRTGAGHVHIGFTENVMHDDPTHKEMCNMLVRELDLFLGLPSLFLDTDTKRRELYGKAGACRYKSYGVEYRVLSNFWLQTPELIDWVYDGVDRAIQSLCSGETLSSNYPDIQEVINTSNKERAKEILEDIGYDWY
jgi:hypothetical protein